MYNLPSAVTSVVAYVSVKGTASPLKKVVTFITISTIWSASCTVSAVKAGITVITVYKQSMWIQ